MNSLPPLQQQFLNQYPRSFALAHFSQNIPLSTMRDAERRFSCDHATFDLQFRILLACILKTYPDFNLATNLDNLNSYTHILPVRMKAFLSMYYAPQSVPQAPKLPSCNECCHLNNTSYSIPVCTLLDEPLTTYYDNPLIIRPHAECPERS